MSRIEWDQVGERFYEAGIDRGVLYLADGRGVAWNGLTGVDEESVSSSEPFYIDGVKYIDLPTIEDYAATLKVFTYPDEFQLYDGLFEIEDGLFVDDQRPQQFGLSYRTRVGNDVDGELGHKIHLVYNLMATPDTRAHATLSRQLSPTDFAWKLASVPEHVNGFRPTAHAIVDTTLMNPYMLMDLERILYGDEDNDASLPPLPVLASYLATWTP